MSRFARKHYRVAKKEVVAQTEGIYKVKEETAVLIAAVVILALLGAFVKGLILGRWFTKK